MKSVGMVVEYNPFHNGHLYHLTESKRRTGAEVAIAVMSGHFLQRGEPALVSKWTRTKMALQAGVDIVVELPYAFAVQKAETFARGAVHMLEALQSTAICFGSEEGEIQPFKNAYRLIQTEQEAFQQNIRLAMQEGISYPSAVAQAFVNLPTNHEGNISDLSKPNNILGFHYVAALLEKESRMEIHTIKRQLAGYHDEDFKSDTIASATAIRKAIQESDGLDSILPFIPQSSFEELQAYQKAFSSFHNWEKYWPFLQYQLLTMDHEQLEEIYEMEEGLQYRLKKFATQTDSFQMFMGKIKTKRYTWTRLQRLCVHVLTNTTKKMIETQGMKPPYIRILGMTSAGRMHLNSIKKSCPLPLISKLSAVPDEMVSLDIKATSVFSQALKEPERSLLRKMEFKQPPIIVP